MTYEISYVIDLYFGLMVDDLLILDHEKPFSHNSFKFNF